MEVTTMTDVVKPTRLVRTPHPLTTQGQTTVDETLPHAQHISELTFGDLNADERQQLTALLRRISGTA